MFLKDEIIDMGIRIEKNGEQVYLRAIGKVEDTGLKELLEWMAGEERRHAEWLSKFRDEMGKDGTERMFKEMSDDLLRDAIGDQSFSLRDVDFSAVGNPGELIDVWVEFEKDTILFYEMLQTFLVDENALARISEIIGEEETHIRKIKELLIQFP